VDFKIILTHVGEHVSKVNPITYYFTEAAAHLVAGRTEVKTEAAAMVKDNFAMQTITIGQLVDTLNLVFGKDFTPLKAKSTGGRLSD
jgi:hypothetical protein